MSMQGGNYKGKVKSFAMEVIGAENWPILKVEFLPISFKRGSVFVEGQFSKVDKLYFLKSGLVEKGPNAGKSHLEVLRKELKEVYGHEGGLDVNEMAHCIDKELDITVELNQKGYPQVKYVNAPGARKFAAKAIPADILAKLQADYQGGGATPTPTETPSNFFANLASAA